MSITFLPVARSGDTFRRMFRCDCAQRWCDACDQAELAGEDFPPTFICDACTVAELNMSNVNAADLLRWLQLPAEPGGEILATELAARCRRRLWDEPRNHDAGLTPEEQLARHFGPEERQGICARVIISERRPDYLREKTERLLQLCEKAGENWITWG